MAMVEGLVAPPTGGFADHNFFVTAVRIGVDEAKFMKLWGNLCLSKLYEVVVIIIIKAKIY